jgi:hypothetical protein
MSARSVVVVLYMPRQLTIHALEQKSKTVGIEIVTPQTIIATQQTQ